jgi:zinc D-Ala-D-Ala carboxypeptidase
LGDLTKDFSRSEFACKCGCGLDSMNLFTIQKLQSARDLTGIAFFVVSGIRCATHNAASGGRPNSAHLRGHAVDLACANDHIRYLMLKELILHFDRLEVGRTWIHIDDDPTLLHEVIFLP